MLELIDRWLVDVGTQKLVDGDKVRDMLLDLRLLAARGEETDDTIHLHEIGAGAYPLVVGEEAER